MRYPGKNSSQRISSGLANSLALRLSATLLTIEHVGHDSLQIRVLGLPARLLPGGLFLEKLEGIGRLAVVDTGWARPFRTDLPLGLEGLNIRFVDQVTRPTIRLGCSIDRPQLAGTDPVQDFVRADAKPTCELGRRQLSWLDRLRHARGGPLRHDIPKRHSASAAWLWSQRRRARDEPETSFCKSPKKSRATAPLSLQERSCGRSL